MKVILERSIKVVLERRSVIDQFFTMKHILAKFWEYNIDVHQIFVDFKQAYDSIERELLYEIMLRFGIPGPFETKVVLKKDDGKVMIQSRNGNLESKEVNGVDLENLEEFIYFEHKLVPKVKLVKRRK